MRVLVTGAGGFVGRHLIAELEAAGHETVRLTHHSDPHPAGARPIEITDAEAVLHAVADARPEACVHLAALAFVPDSWKSPGETFRVNVGGTANLLEAIRARAPKCRTLVVSTAQIYGNQPREKPLGEDDAAWPDHPYGVSKLAADALSLLLGRHNKLHVMTARPCNHVGPGQPPAYAVAAFAAQVAAIASGAGDPVIKVGNLDSEREFLDVRDVVRAYRLLLEKGSAGNAYNVASGIFRRMREVLDTLCRLAGVSPRVEVDPARFRPTDTQPHLDTARLKRDTGWEPALPFEKTLADMLAAAR